MTCRRMNDEASGLVDHDTVLILMYNHESHLAWLNGRRSSIWQPHVYDIASHHEHKLVEALGERIAEAILGKFDIDAVTVTVRKPKPIAGVLEYAGIRIRRERCTP